MHILVAPNAFKNSLPAKEVANAIKEGLQQSRLNCTIECFPVGDGGDGTGTILLERLNAEINAAQVHDPLGRIVDSYYGMVKDQSTAIIELANASGLRLIKAGEPDPLHATTFGTGELIQHALDNGVSRIILCIGGSATVDGGAGILQALGTRFMNNKGELINDLPAGLKELEEIDLSALDQRILKCELIILCDVDNPLLGANGAAPVFGPQKGASPDEVRQLEFILTTISKCALRQTGRDISMIKHGGAAGGTAAGLHAFLNARLVNGIDYFMDSTGFNKALEKADLLITGEGSVDKQTLQGKAPLGVARKAKEKNIPVIALAGKVPLTQDKELREYFSILLPISHGLLELEELIKYTRQNLQRTAREVGNLLAIGKIL